MISQEEFNAVPEEVFQAVVKLEISDKEKEEILDTITNFDDKQMAVFEYFNCLLDLVDDIAYADLFSNNTFVHGKKVLLVLTDDEADEKVFQYFENKAKDEVPEMFLPYLDIDAMANDACRGEILASYDGIEHESADFIYIYRIE